MGSMMSCFTVLSGVAAAILLGLLKDEVSAWLPRLASAILKFAAGRLATTSLRERYLEEWTSHASDYPGKLSQLVQSCLCVKASFGITPISRRYKYFILFLLLIHTTIAVGAPNLIYYMNPECECVVRAESYLSYLALVIPATMFNIAVEFMLERMGWLHHRSRRRS